MLYAMREIEGWLSDQEADLLAAAATRALRRNPRASAIVEVGSYCGKSTVVLGSVVRAEDPTARVYAVDPHQGIVGARGQSLHRCAPTLDRFKSNVARNGLSEFVVPVVSRSTDVAWTDPVCFLFIDGLHDHASVFEDFLHFRKFVLPRGMIAFHDYSPSYPGVIKVVDELLADGSHRTIDWVDSLYVVAPTSGA
jgi:hypothetical protein